MCPIPFDMGSSFAREVAGVDLGSAYIKVVLFYDHTILSTAILPSTKNVTLTANRAFEQALESAGLNREEIKAIAVTGGNADRFESAHQIFENSLCIARGVSYLHSPVRTVIDLGHESARVYRIALKGPVPRSMGREAEVVKSAAGHYGRDKVGRIIQLTERTGFEADGALVGGGANDTDLVKGIESGFIKDLIIPEAPAFVAALGAALLAEQTLISRH